VSQRPMMAILGTLCLALLGYLMGTTYLSGAKPAGEWERASETYVQEYHHWLSASPGSGWARVQALATGPERHRVEELKQAVTEPIPWEYGGGTYRLLVQTGGRALVHASYALRRGLDKKSVDEIYLLSNTVTGIKVIQLIAGRSQP